MDNSIYLELTKPMEVRWRVATGYKEYKKCQCVAYIDARDVMNRLDSAIGFGLWQTDYKEVDSKTFCGIGIYNNDIKEWVWKWDVGVESNIEKEKGEASDAFKRAAVRWGIGRFVYDYKNVNIKYQEYDKNKKWYPADNLGKLLFTGDELSSYINNSPELFTNIEVL